MLKNIVNYCIHHPLQILMMTFLISLAGIYSFKELAIDAVPDITNTQVQVNTKADGLGPEEVELLVTLPIELALTGIPGVDQVRSITRYALSQVTVSFRDGTDIYLARQLINERLNTLKENLPQKSIPTLSPITSGLGEVYHYVIDYKFRAQGVERERQLSELRAMQDWDLRSRLMTVKGVSEVNSIGGFEKQYIIEPNTKKLTRYGIDLLDLAQVVEDANRNTGGGYIEQTGDQFLVSAKGRFESIDDISNLAVKTLENMQVLQVKDLAEVKLGQGLRTGAALLDGEEVVLGTVLMLSGENSREVANNVHQKILEIQASLPNHLEIKTLYNRSDLVDETIATVNENIIAGAVLVIIVLLLLVGNIRAALISAIVIPLSLLISFIVMKQMGISGNLMSLGALDFGVITDGAVIVLDNCLRLLSQKKKDLGRNLTVSEKRETILNATLQIRKSAGFGELIVAMSFLPIFSFVGVEGKMFIPMASTFIIAILGSLILSFTFVPAMATLILGKNTQDKEPWLMATLHHLYLPLLDRALEYKKTVITSLVMLVLLGGFLTTRIGGEFLPKLDEGSIAIQFIRPVSTGISHSVSLDAKSMEVILEVSEVSHVFSRIGTAEIALDPMGPNISDAYIMLKAQSMWSILSGKSRSKKEIIDDIIGRLDQSIPGQRLLVSQPIQLRFNELLEGTRADVSLKVFGDDLVLAGETAEKIEALLKEIPNAGDIEVEIKGQQSILEIIPDKAKLKLYGISPTEILETVEVLIGGKVIGKFYEEQKNFDIVMRMNSEDRRDLDKISRLPVFVSTNKTVPLEDLAQLKFRDAASSFSRENAKRRVAILINPRGMSTEEFVDLAAQMIEDKINLPSGIHLEWGGNFKNLAEARSRLLILGPLTLLLILFMIHATFGKIWQTILVSLTVPLAMIGGVISLYLSGEPFTLSAGIGFIALCGISVLNGVVLVSFFNELNEQGIRGRTAIIKGTGLRLRPVLMTAMTDVLGFIPMALSVSTGAEVQRPVAIVIIGGILASTILTLIVLPTLYWMIETNFLTKDVK